MHCNPPEQHDNLLGSARVRQQCGGISNMTLWRLEQKQDFPAPDFVINRRKFWRRSTIEHWLATRAPKAPTAEARHKRAEYKLKQNAAEERRQMPSLPNGSIRPGLTNNSDKS